MANTAQRPANLPNRRLDPEIRKNIILDRTAELVAREGVSAVSMERIGREAGVSKALVYAYFKNQIMLLQALLIREQRRLLEKQAAVVSKARNFDELILLTTRTYLQHYEADGLLLRRLLHEPSVAGPFEEADRRERARAIAFLAHEITRTYGVVPHIAEAASELSMGMTGAAGEMIARGAITRGKAEEILLCMFEGVIRSLSERFARPGQGCESKS